MHNARVAVSAMYVVALGLQGLLLIHLVLILRHGVSLQGEGLEILFLVTTLGISLWVLLQTRLGAGSRWMKGLYLLNSLGQLPLWLTAALMVLFVYVTDPVDTFEMANGTRVVLKSHGGILGCSVHPYIIQGIFEQLIHQEDYISCFNFLDTKISKSTWNAAETELTVEVESIEYTFKLKAAANSPKL